MRVSTDIITRFGFRSLGSHLVYAVLAIWHVGLVFHFFNYPQPLSGSLGSTITNVLLGGALCGMIALIPITICVSLFTIPHLHDRFDCHGPLLSLAALVFMAVEFFL